MGSIFLSHNSADKPFVRKLANDLRRNGHYAWVDEAEINIGDSLIEKIEAGIDTMEYLGVVISSNSIDSEWVKREVRIALTQEIFGKRVKVLPLLLEKVDMPTFLIDKKYADFTSEDVYKSSLNDLLKVLSVIPDYIEKTSYSADEVRLLKRQLKEMNDALEITRGEKRRAIERLEKERANISEKLKESIRTEQNIHPEFSDVDRLYAFECGNMSVTAGYLLHALKKEAIKGGHPLAMFCNMYNKTDELKLLLEATLSRLDALEPGTVTVL